MRIHIVAAGALVLATLGCADRRPYELRFTTDAYSIRVSATPTPPVAREDVIYKVVVQDRETGEPIEGGEGQVFATGQDRRNAWDSFVPGPQVGSYTARLRFLTAGDWAIAIRFRKDSTARLERVDWIQGVRAPKGAGA